MCNRRYSSARRSTILLSRSKYSPLSSIVSSLHCANASKQIDKKSKPKPRGKSRLLFFVIYAKALLRRCCMLFIVDCESASVMLMASPIICGLNPLAPNLRRPAGAFLPAPVGAGSAPTPERAWLALRTFKKSLAPCPLWSTPSAGRCTQPMGNALEFRALALPRAGLLRLRCSFPEIPSWLLVPGPLTLAGWWIENLAVDACPARHLVYQIKRQKQAPPHPLDGS